MIFETSERTRELSEKLLAFMDKYIYPSEAIYQSQLDTSKGSWQSPLVMEELKSEARKQNLWNLFLPESKLGGGLTNLEYAPLCEIMGRSLIAPEAFNCAAPDTGNMETLVRYGTEQQKEQWLALLLDGKIRSTFCMTEPDVASSDATNIQSSVVRENDEYVVNGHKWWSSGAMDRRCTLLIFMGKSDPNAEKYRQQSMILIPKETPGVTIKRSMPVFGYDDAPRGHAEIEFRDVRIPLSNILLGEGRGFEIAQGRLGPGRIHHCMRLIGMAERALEGLCRRAKDRVAFNKPLSEQGVVRQQIAESRMEIDQSRLLTLYTAWKMDTVGNKEARKEISEIKVVATKMACAVLDRAIQVHGAAGVCDDFGLARAYAKSRSIRIADGPDEVHTNLIGRFELKKYD